MAVVLGEARLKANKRIYAIGDVHGCLDELRLLLNDIQSHFETHPVAEHKIILLGDYVDRGPKSAETIDYLIELKARDPAVFCLFGNHDEKLLRTLKPMAAGSCRAFMKYGGGTTLKSYGFSDLEIHMLSQSEFEPSMARAFAKTMANRLPRSHRKFLRSCVHRLSVDDYYFCHAGIDPHRPLGWQRKNDLIWMREPFVSWKEPFSKVIIHGHTRQTTIDVQTNRINLDTSCCYGGLLSALILEGDQYEFLQRPALQTYWKS